MTAAKQRGRPLAEGGPKTGAVNAVEPIIPRFTSTFGTCASKCGRRGCVCLFASYACPFAAGFANEDAFRRVAS
jgi:hypothetical protein